VIPTLVVVCTEVYQISSSQVTVGSSFVSPGPPDWWNISPAFASSRPLGSMT